MRHAQIKQIMDDDTKTAIDGVLTAEQKAQLAKMMGIAAVIVVGQGAAAGWGGWSAAGWVGGPPPGGAGGAAAGALGVAGWARMDQRGLAARLGPADAASFRRGVEKRRSAAAPAWTGGE